MTTLLIVIACIALLWWCVKPKLKAQGFIDGPCIKSDRDRPDWPEGAVSGEYAENVPYSETRLVPREVADEATCGFDNLVAAFSGKTVEQCRAERERNNEVAELQHLGMLREKPKYITAKMRTGSEDLRPMKGIKALCIGDKPFWHNPDYEEGGVFYDRN